MRLLVEDVYCKTRQRGRRAECLSEMARASIFKQRKVTIRNIWNPLQPEFTYSNTSLILFVPMFVHKMIR